MEPQNPTFSTWNFILTIKSLHIVYNISINNKQKV
jgi:hypothetical protein